MTDSRTDFLMSPMGLADDGLTDDGAATQQLGLASVGDRCVVCGSPLSRDQRYCVDCGERRSKPRFAQAEPTAAVPAAAPSPPPARKARISSGGTLVAGVATLLLAMGVGVLIGHDTSTRAAAQPPVHITVQGSLGSAPAAASTTATSPASTGGTSGTTSKKSGASATSKAATKSKAASSKASSSAATAASKVLGGKSDTPPTVTVGAKGKGAGYSGGKFTGNFFGG